MCTYCFGRDDGPRRGRRQVGAVLQGCGVRRVQGRVRRVAGERGCVVRGAAARRERQQRRRYHAGGGRGRCRGRRRGRTPTRSVGHHRRDSGRWRGAARRDGLRRWRRQRTRQPWRGRLLSGRGHSWADTATARPWRTRTIVEWGRRVAR